MLALAAACCVAQFDELDLAALPELFVGGDDVAAVRLQPKLLDQLGDVAPAAAEAGSRYLLFDTPAEDLRLSQHHRSVGYFLRLAIRLKRTLVLPRRRLYRQLSTPGNTGIAEGYAAWGQLFNLTALNRLHPVVELGTFLAQQQRLIGSLRVLDAQGCDPSTSKLVSFNGLDDVRAAEVVCAPATQRTEDELEQLGVAAVALSGKVDSLSAFADSSKFRPYLRFAPGVYETAAAFVSKAFGSSPFLAVHWQRTPFVDEETAATGVVQTAHSLVRHVRRHLKRWGVNHVLLVTDSADRNEMGQVKAKLRAVRYESSQTADGSVEVVHAEHVQVVACSMAAYFLGTHGADLSRVIMDERIAVFGHSPPTASEMSDAGARSAFLSAPVRGLMGGRGAAYEWRERKDEL